MKALTIGLIALIIPLFCACKGWKSETPKCYDLNQPHVIQLTDDLREISGLSYSKGQSAVYAISDDNGYIFTLQLDAPYRISKTEFHKTRDFEGLVVHEGKGYVINSNGNIKTFKLENGKVSDIKDLSFPFGGRNEFEILYYDNHKHLIIICKDCEKDKKKTVSAFTFSLDKLKYKKAGFDIKADDIAEEIGHDNIKFKPSAASIHPLTGELYIISSINQLLVIASRKGKIKEVYKLDRALFKQPEGLTFAPNGDMIISNESAGKGRANLLIFRYKQP